MFDIDIDLGLPSIDEVVSNPLTIFNPAASIISTSLTPVARGVNEGIGELTGRNAMRGYLNDQRNAYLDYQAEQEVLFKNEQQRRYNQDLIASRAAGGRNRRSQTLLGSGSYSNFNPSDLYLGGL